MGVALSSVSFPIQLAVNGPEKAAEGSSRAWAPTPTWETWIKLLTLAWPSPSFSVDRRLISLFYLSIPHYYSTFHKNNLLKISPPIINKSFYFIN